MDIQKNLKDFANAIFEIMGWPEGWELDGAEFQEIAVKYGLLVPETRYKPCGEICNCAEFYTQKEIAQGITCLRKAEWLNTDVDTLRLTTDAADGGKPPLNQENTGEPEMLTCGHEAHFLVYATFRNYCAFCGETASLVNPPFGKLHTRRRS